MSRRILIYYVYFINSIPDIVNIENFDVSRYIPLLSMTRFTFSYTFPKLYFEKPNLFPTFLKSQFQKTQKPWIYSQAYL